MDLISIFLIAVGLAMDAFAVSIVSGISLKSPRKTHAAVIGLFFGVFQFIMPIIGWHLGNYFAEYIDKYAHWVAFFLLTVIGGKMIIESFHNEDNEDEALNIMNLNNLTVLAVATSIDALAVGVSFAAMNSTIWFSAAIIGVVAFGFSFSGVILGKTLGVIVGKRMETIGGIILVSIGLKILTEGIF